MDADERAAALALARCRVRVAPDDRVRVFDLAASVEEGSVVVSGTVSDEELRDRAVAAVEEALSRRTDRAAGDRPVVDHVTVLATDASERTVTEPVLTCRVAPDGDAEPVTQVLYGQIVTAYDRRDDWRRIHTPAGYVAWGPADALGPRTDAAADAVVDAVAIRDVDPVDRLYAGTPCERRGRNGDVVTVAFATGAEASLPAAAVAVPDGDPAGDDVVATAETYLETDYRWGGMTVEGIDCSGLVWMAYRRYGLVLPRDSDQQRAVGRPVGRAELAPGDLLFFPGHVAVSAGGEAVVHAARDAGGVVRASLDPEAGGEGAIDAGYSERLDEEFEYARRLL
jgi:cell wall-associated NlpC family hydrolase